MLLLKMSSLFTLSFVAQLSSWDPTLSRIFSLLMNRNCEFKKSHLSFFSPLWLVLLVPYFFLIFPYSEISKMFSYIIFQNLCCFALHV